MFSEVRFAFRASETVLAVGWNGPLGGGDGLGVVRTLTVDSQIDISSSKSIWAGARREMCERENGSQQRCWLARDEEHKQRRENSRSNKNNICKQKTSSCHPSRRWSIVNEYCVSIE